MVKASWGSKRTCPCGNGVRFYDLNKKEIECPGCGENINVEQLSISTLENNLRKKSQTQIIEEKRTKVDKKPPSNVNINFCVFLSPYFSQKYAEKRRKRSIKKCNLI